jgi:hypothetical protein
MGRLARGGAWYGGGVEEEDVLTYDGGARGRRLAKCHHQSFPFADFQSFFNHTHRHHVLEIRHSSGIFSAILDFQRTLTFIRPLGKFLARPAPPGDQFSPPSDKINRPFASHHGSFACCRIRPAPPLIKLSNRPPSSSS